MRPIPTPRRRKTDERLAAAKQWQDEERAAARERVLGLAATTPEWTPGRDEEPEP